MMRITLKCQYCGKEFQVIPERKNTAKYCSWECQILARKGKERKPELRRYCVVCGKRFLPKYTQRKHEGWGKYCSMECYNKARASDVELKCDYCGKTFVRKRYRLKKNAKHHYCSVECRNKANRGENYNPNIKDYRDGQYKKLAKKLREEAKECEDCHQPAETYEIHHIIPPWLFDNRKEAHDRKNLVVLCKKCHRKRHRKTMNYLFSLFRKFCKENPEIREEIVKNWNLQQ